MISERKLGCENNTSLQCSALKTEWDSYGTPEVTTVHYDLWELRIETLLPGWMGPVYIVFDTCEGYRVLDESRLTQYGSLTGDEFIYIIHDNGWRSIEAGLQYGLHSEKEYFIVGINDCVSVVSRTPPKVYSPGEPDSR